MPYKEDIFEIVANKIEKVSKNAIVLTRKLIPEKGKNLGIFVLFSADNRWEDEFFMKFEPSHEGGGDFNFPFSFFFIFSLFSLFSSLLSYHQTYSFL
jgi:hypothetical protein